MDFSQLIDKSSTAMVDDLSTFIQCPSISGGEPLPGKPFGEEVARALDYILGLGRSMGFTVRNGDGYYGTIDLGDSQDYVAVICHIDVVPVGGGWIHDPFGGVVDGDKIYGRGTMDDKGPAITALYAMKAIKDSGAKISKRIRLILGCDEELNWGCMKHYVANERLPLWGFTPDADYPMIFAEKGITHLDLTGSRREEKGLFELVSVGGGDAVNVVCDQCEAVLRPLPGKEQQVLALLEGLCSAHGRGLAQAALENGLVRLVSAGIPAHGSTPEKGTNAISIVMEILGHAYGQGGGSSALVEFYNSTLAFDVEGGLLGCACADEMSGKLSCNVGVIRADYEERAEEVIKIDIRYPSTLKLEQVEAGIQATCGKFGRKAVVFSHKEPIYVDPNSKLANTLMEVYREETGDVDSKPMAIGGGTYARAMPNIAAFGPIFEGEPELAHQKNEFASIPNLIRNCKIQAKALYRLAL